MAWVRRHDDYDDVKAAKSCCGSEPASAEGAWSSRAGHHHHEKAWGV